MMGQQNLKYAICYVIILFYMQPNFNITYEGIESSKRKKKLNLLKLILDEI